MKEAVRNEMYKVIKDLVIGDKINQIFRIKESKIAQTQKAQKYIRLILADSTGEILANVWGVSSLDSFQENSFLLIDLEIIEFNGSKIGKIKGQPMQVEKPADSKIYYKSAGLSDEQINILYDELLSHKEDVKDIYVKTYLDVMFDINSPLIALFKEAPASASNRGAYRGGLVEHLSRVMKMAISCGQLYSANNDIIIAAVLAHDVGKAYSYQINQDGVSNTESGELLGHLPISYAISVQTFIQAESILRKSIPEYIKNHINHCILSHHGKLAYGSPIEPKSIEAQIIHMADITDSSITNYRECVNEMNVISDRLIKGNHFSNKVIFVHDRL